MATHIPCRDAERWQRQWRKPFDGVLVKSRWCVGAGPERGEFHRQDIHDFGTMIAVGDAAAVGDGQRRRGGGNMWKENYGIE